VGAKNRREFMKNGTQMMRLLWQTGWFWFLLLPKIYIVFPFHL